MASIKSKLIGFTIRHSYLLRGSLHKERFDMSTSIARFRDDCEKGAARHGKLAPGTEVRETNADGIHAELLIPEEANSSQIILYVHGGGYVSGSCSDHRAFVSKFATYTGVQCLVYEYRLAPEHPYPAALDDSVKVYCWLLSAGFRPEDILIAGESAGGGLTLALLLKLRDFQIPLPSGAVAISPWTDLTCSGESYKTKNRYSPAPQDSWHVFSRHYCGENTPSNPYISPLYGDLKGLPPLFINSGEYDELFDDGKSFSEKARAAGVDVTFVPGNKMLHCYPLLAPMFPEATKAMSEIAGFVKLHLKNTPNKPEL